MSPRLKQILQIVGVLAAAGLFIFGIYWVIFRQATDLTVDNVNGVPTGQLPDTNGAVNRTVTDPTTNATLPTVPGQPIALPPDEVASGGNTAVQQLVREPISAAVIGPNGSSLQYYDKNKGQFFNVSADGRTKQLLTASTFASVQEVTWSPNGNLAILEFPDSSKLLYDFAKKQQVTLPQELEDFSFAPDSSKMAFKYLGATEDDQWLAVANPDGSGAQIIEVIGDQAPKVNASWSPNQQIVATYSKATSANQQEIIFIGQYNENFKSLEVSGAGFQSQWSPSGESLLYSTYDATTNYNPSLNITLARGDTIGQNNQSLNVQTWPDKCAFSGTGVSVICAVPSYLPTGAGIRREAALGIPDELYQINLATGTKQLLARPVSDNGLTQYTMSNLQLAEAEDLLYFTDETTGQLLSLRLR